MSDYRQEGTGKVITEQQLLKLVSESGLSAQEIIQGNNLKPITEDSGNTTGAATTTANVVPTNQIADTDLTLENGSLESLEGRTSGTIAPNSFFIENPNEREVIDEYTNKRGRKVKTYADPTEEEILRETISNLDEPEFISNRRGRKVKNPKYVAPEARPNLEIQAKALLKDNDLDIEYTNTYFNPTKDTGFVDKHYGIDNLLSSGLSIDEIADFQGSLQKDDFVEDFEKDIEGGVYEKQGGIIYTGGDVTDIQVAKERALARKLSQYMAERDNRLNDKALVNAIIENPENFDSSKTLDEVREDAYKNKMIGYTNYDQKAVQEYVQARFPALMAKNAKNKKNKIEAYKKRKKFNEESRGLVKGLANVGEFISEIPSGFYQGLDEMAIWLDDSLNIFGGNERAKQMRLVNIEQEIADDDSLEYFYVSGKGKEIDGVKYIKDEKGNIYDTSNGVNVSEILDSQEVKSISKEIDKDGKNTDDYSFRGGANMAGKVTGNILFDVIGTKGFGSARLASSAAYLAKANKFKSVSQLRKYAAMAERGGTNLRNIRNIGTFGKKMPFNPQMLDATMYYSFRGGITGYENTINAAMQAGLSSAEAEKLADQAQLEMSIVYGLSTPFNPKIGMVNKLDDFITKSKIFSEAVNAYKKSGSQKAFSESIKGQLQKSGLAIGQKGLAFTKEGAKEVLQENLQQFGEIEIVNRRVNEEAGFNLLQQDYSNDDFVNTSILSFAVGGLMGGISTPNFTVNPNKKLQNLYLLSQDLKNAEQRLNKMVETGRITQEDANGIVEQAKAVGQSSNKMPAWMLKTPDALIKASIVQSQIDEATKEKNQLSKPMRVDVNKRIADLEQELSNIREEGAKELVTSETATIEKIVGKDNVKSFDSAIEMVEAISKIKGENYTLEDMTLDMSSDGFIEQDGVIYINKEVAAKTQAISVASHELLHKVLKSEFKNNPEMKRVVNEFKKILKDKGILQPIEARAEMYRQRGVGDVDGADADEYFTFFSDSIAKNELPFESLQESQWVKIGKLVANLFNTRFGTKNLKFNSGQQVFDFIKDYQAGIQKGKLTSQAKKKLKDSDGKIEKKRSVSSINQQLEQLETDYENAEIDFDVYEQQLANLETKLERAEKAETVVATKDPKKDIVVFDKSAVSQKAKTVAKPKPVKADSQSLKESTAKSKKELDDIGNNPDGFNKNNPKIYTILEGFIKSKSLVFKTKKGNIVNLNSLPGFDMDSMVSETIANMLPYIAKFNPKQNDSLFGYLMAQLNNRMKGALNTGKVTDSAFDVDVSEAKGITASEPTAPAVPEKTKYKNLVQQKVLSTDGLKTVRDKVISSVRVLKSKFDASVTKNVSVPPIIAEIKKDIGKQADIVLKKEMGGVKNNELQNYLKTNKKAILENMTTFYLTKAFPEAIQKSVGGKYLLDKDGKRVINTFGDATFVPNFVNSDVWRGAKIDREKTSTEAKGKTSGNEIIRRVPNISQAISDELFLSSIIGPDGKPIRGRKESLAKAIGEEIAFDIINQDLKTDGPISEALKNNQKALGVDVTEHFEEELSRQIERGNIKRSMTLSEGTKILEEGLVILENNGFEQLSSEFLEWKNKPDHKEVVDIWDEYYQGLFSKTDAAVRKTFTKAKKEYQNKFTYLEDALNKFEEGGLNSIYPAKKALALSQLEDFWNIISGAVDPAVANIKGFNFLGAVSRTSKPSKSVESNLKSKPKRVSKEVQDAFNNLKPVLGNVRIYSGSGFALNAVKDFVTNFKGNPADAVTEFNKSKLGKETRLAKEANTLLFKYLNALALDTVLEQKNQADVNKAFTGYLRWLETNNNNDAGLKGLAHVMGFEVLSDQAIYTDSTGKKYYSKKSEMAIVDGSEKLTKGQIKINKNHSSWKAATKAMEQLIANSKPKKQKEWKKLTEFEKDQDIAASIQLMGEHQQSMGETGIRLAEAVGNAVESVFTNGVSKKEAFNIYSLKVNNISSEFGIVLNSRFISEIQDKKFGKTSKLGKSRLFILPKNIKDNIVSLQGDLIYEQGKKELTNVFKEVVKAQELSAANNKIESSKKATQTSKKQSLTKEFNSIIERNKGIDAGVTYSKIVAKRMGAGIGKYKFYIPSSAEDFRLLTGYTFSGKGKQGTKDMAWFDKNLIRPYTEGVAAIDVAKQTTKNDFKTLNKAMPNIAKTIGDLIPTKDYTNDQAVRVYLWNKAGFGVPGLNEKEVGALVAYVAGNPELALYAESLLAISKSNEWLKPSEHWDVGTILSDINNLTEKGGRKAYLAQWIENVDEIFSDENLNKIEALYGKRHVSALKDSLYRMKNGTNRPSGTNAQVNKWNNWLNNSIGSIMFFNRRSALLQLLSTSNFLNWSDNNPVKAAAAFANQKQYWKDFSTLFNSDKLKQRRGGLRADVNEAEIANEAANSKNKATAALSWLLKKGFTPTQIADSFAISSGGATFYRNRINTYLGQKDADGNSLYTEKQAEDKAFLDFIEVSDQSQQSSDPSLVSMEQASVLGRLVLAFQNTTQQYSRIMKRSALDIIKRRQMPGTTSMLQSDFSNFSKIMYYGAIQNLIFNSLSAAIFALIPGFGEEEEEEEIDKSTAEKLKRITNGSIDSILKGTGVRGAVVAQIKNTIMEYFKQKDKGFTGDQTYTIIQVANLSPPIGSKLKKIYGAIKGEQYGSGAMKERGFDLTANGRLNLSPSYAVLGSLASGTANIPLDRMYAEIQSVSEMLDNRNTIYQRLALSLGFRTWDVNAKNEEDDLIKAQLKETKKTKQKEKAKAKRVDASKQKIVDRRKAYESLTDGQKQYIISLGKNARKKALDKAAKQLKEKE